MPLFPPIVPVSLGALVRGRTGALESSWDVRRLTSVLLVDADESQRLLVADMLRNEGYHVIEAGSGSEALGARRDRIDVAVVGCELGDIPGVDVLRALRAGGWRGPAILMGREAEADAVEAGRLGAEVLATPFAVEELLGAVLGALIAEALVAETA